MIVTFIVALVIIMVLGYMASELRRAYRQSSEAYRNEYITPVLFFGTWYRPLPFGIPRCWLPLMLKWCTIVMLGYKFGVSTMAVTGIVIHQGKLMVGRRKTHRMNKGWSHDLGVMGMVPHGMSLMGAMHKELAEEINIKEHQLIYWTMLGPMQGQSVFVWLYKIDCLGAMPQLPEHNEDEVFESLAFVQYDELLKLQTYLFDCDFVCPGMALLLNSGRLSRLLAGLE